MTGWYEHQPQPRQRSRTWISFLVWFWSAPTDRPHPGSLCPNSPPVYGVNCMLDTNSFIHCYFASDQTQKRSSPSQVWRLHCLYPEPGRLSSYWCCPSPCLRSAQWGTWSRPAPWTQGRRSARTRSPPGSSLLPGQHSQYTNNKLKVLSRGCPVTCGISFDPRALGPSLLR